MPSRQPNRSPRRHLAVAWALACLWPAGARAAQALPAQAELVFSDAFDRADLDPAWQPRVGSWQVAEGALQGQGPDAFIVLSQPAGVSSRLEYTAWSDVPCDLSACLNLDAGASRPGGLFFQFGGMWNKRSAVVVGQATLWEAPAPLIRPGVRHRVICERWGIFTRFTVDGQVLFQGVVPEANRVTGADAGFFIYKSGWIDDVRLYRYVGDPTGDIARVEPELQVRTWLGFEHPGAAAAPPLPPGWTLSQGEGRAGVVVTRDYANPDPLPRWVEDRCLELQAGAGGQAPRVQGLFAPQATGLIEFEAFAEPEPGVSDTGFALALLDTAGQPAATLAVDGQRRFVASGAVLEPLVNYTGINPKPPLRFLPGRWWRVRVQFDAVAEGLTAALVAMYVPERSYNPFPATGHWFVFGKDVPFAQAAVGGKIGGLQLSVAGRGRLRLDNLYAIAPSNGVSVNGRDVRKPARELLGTAEHPRHDPLDLTLYSLRETLGTQGNYGETDGLRGGKYPEVVKAALAYDALLVRHAFLETRARALLRGDYALRQRKAETAASKRQVEAATITVTAAEADLAVLYRTYLDAYLDGLNVRRMTDEVMPAVERMGKSLDAVDQQLARAEKGLGLELLPNPGPAEVRAEKGRYRTAAGPALYFPQTNWLYWPEEERLLRLDGCPTVYGNVFAQSAEAEYLNASNFERYVSWYLQGMPQGKFVIADLLGLHSCYTLMPDWWLTKHAADPDVFLCDAAGKTPLRDGKPWETDGRAQLNFWNPEVRATMRAKATQCARYFATRWPGRIMAWEVLQEAHSDAGFAQTGYNASAKLAFRERLRGTYGTVEVLNQKWQTEYAGFDEVQPPAPDAPLPSPVNYEFQRFRQEGYRDWVAAYRDALRTELPDVPVVNRIVDIIPFPTDHLWSFDFTTLYPVFDYFEFHTSMGERARLCDRMMASLRRAFGGEAAVMEWGLGSSGELFDERGARRATEAEFFRLAAGGRSLFNVWYGTNPGWADCANWTDPRWGHTTLRYSATAIPVSVARLRQFERALLDYPQVAPRVNILESNSSFLNAVPVHGPRSRLVLCGQTLDSGGVDYGFLWEDLVQSGRQSLAGSSMLLLPCATCLAEPVQERLIEWLRAGGKAVAIAPPGVYDPWGRPSGKLLAAAFPRVTWVSPGAGQWEPQGGLLPAKSPSHPFLGDLYRARLAKGELLVFTKVDNNARPEADPALLELIRSLAPPPLFAAAHNRFELTLRHDANGKRYFLTALNGDLHAAAQDEVLMRLPPRTARDIETGVALPLRRRGNVVALSLALAPGEGVVIELRD